MKIKKYFVGFIASTMLVSTCYCIKPVEAIDFSKDESKYMSLCASGKLTNSNKKTCEEFNSYLKAKNKKLKKDLENQKVTLENAKIVLEEQKKEQAAIQVQYETLLEEQRKQIASTQDAIYDYGAASESLAAAIDKFNAEAYETKPSTARPAPPASNNTNSNNSNNTGNNNSNNNNNNNSSNNNSNSNTNNNTNNSNTNNTTSSNLGYKIYEVARSKLGCRYYWGANGPNMFDCSGLVYYCLNHAGKSVGRTTAAGYSSMFSGVSWSNSQTGDLACFGTGSVTHIGIVMLNSDGTRSLIHCGGGGSHTFGNDPNACVKISDFQPGSYYYKRIITIRHVS